MKVYLDVGKQLFRNGLFILAYLDKQSMVTNSKVNFSSILMDWDQ